MRFAAVLLVSFACSGTFAGEPGHACTFWVPSNCPTVDPASFGSVLRR